ncbi:hypothetical protein FHS95_000143 [Sphingomonas naasensis]|uniref:Uncharacterized protein n=1 Tax=Sphingomonas naasensis TaxID=1344951 RepID=A0A4S1WQX2_9SPHN|nr:hypothetical protein [Sphingomonas naasensis]NIJ18474.1 hypothetical protein [Sphingomonas naasensis]TGX45734.1 hypothetical protein E5A74_00695 [Sphingomonas naasensis]
MEKIVTKKSFIGGRLVYPGETVDVDAKGEALPAASTPIGQMTVEQLRAALANREAEEAGDGEPRFGANVADATEANTGAQQAAMAPVAPGNGLRPQTLPPGTVEHNNTFIRPAPADAPAAVEVVVGPAAEVGDVSLFDGDGDGKPGGSMPQEPVALGGKNKAQLLEIAAAEKVEVAEGATNDEIREAIEAKRNDA